MPSRAMGQPLRLPKRGAGAKYKRRRVQEGYRRVLSGNSSVGRAQPCQGWGREFEPRFPLQISSANTFQGKIIEMLQ